MPKNEASFDQLECKSDFPVLNLTCRIKFQKKQYLYAGHYFICRQLVQSNVRGSSISR
jgi:hypothetical protein